MIQIKTLMATTATDNIDDLVNSWIKDNNIYVIHGMEYIGKHYDRVMIVYEDGRYP